MYINIFFEYIFYNSNLLIFVYFFNKTSKFYFYGFYMSRKKEFCEKEGKVCENKQIQSEYYFWSSFDNKGKRAW